MILTDDQGWTSVSYRADPDRPDSVSDYIETPNLEALAQEGMQLLYLQRLPAAPEILDLGVDMAGAATGAIAFWWWSKKKS
mgnify:CR=1 FL=1